MNNRYDFSSYWRREANKGALLGLVAGLALVILMPGAIQREAYYTSIGNEESSNRLYVLLFLRDLLVAASIGLVAGYLVGTVGAVIRRCYRTLKK